MSKAAFKLPERPATNPAADAWVGEGTAIPAGQPKAAPVVKPARLTIDLPPELHARFKSACALKGTKMVAEVVRFIEDYTQKS
jgi:hypothetical protein